MKPSWIKFGLVFLCVILLIGSYFLFFKKSSKPVPGSCKILEEKYCKQVIFTKILHVDTITVATYVLPAGTPIFSPVDGVITVLPPTQFIDNQTKAKYQYPGIYIDDNSVPEKNSPNTRIHTQYFLTFLLSNEKKKPFDKIPVARGKEIDKMTEEKLSNLGNFSLLVRVFENTEEYNGVTITHAGELQDKTQQVLSVK